MAYTPDYTSGDVSAAAIQSIAVFFIVVAELAAVIVLLALLLWGRKKAKF
jgi:hypothetical protein